MDTYQVQIVITRRTGTDPFQFEEVFRTDPLCEIPYPRSWEGGPDVAAFWQAKHYVDTLRTRASLDTEKLARLIHDATTQRPEKVPHECDYDAADAILAEADSAAIAKAREGRG